ncbi:GMC family oxidoreductase [Campylobacter sp. MIT 99-7217]|uniref:GMC family oxidoreductase n=1 Tax=Campylobacter sp. MIT 99-7217 TaxID=535091 RepID=UPI001158FB42|nr:GMC family oxidoreductase [Campylobacter sp. MIT 99-7217]TQR30944.1 GMC family oxidoreductase [Campylobacter sp. MIT 99-7217]
MAKTLKKADVVVVGLGWASSIVANECAKAGLKVVALERGANQDTSDFLGAHDEYKYVNNFALKQDLSKESVTFRNESKQMALPMRKNYSFDVGNNVGGAGVHWNGMSYRFLPYDFELKSMTEQRYGKNKISKDYSIQDWGLSYDEMEKYYDKAEKMMGISGEDKSPFSGKRKNPFPNPPLEKTTMLHKFEKAAKKLGYNPCMVPAANCSQPYENSDKQSLGACQYCAFCEHFGCEYAAKASPLITTIPSALATKNLSIITHANVIEILHKNGRASGVKFINTLTLEEFIQPAEVIMLGSYVFNNARLLMHSKIGEIYDEKSLKGTLGKNYSFQITPSVNGFFDEPFNVYLGAGALCNWIDDFNGDNFDHSKLDFIHGASFRISQNGARPIASNPIEPGTPTWGAAFKKASVRNYTRFTYIGAQGASLPHNSNYLSLDPTYKDAYGLPLIRITYDYTKQDRKLYDFMLPKLAGIMKEMGARKFYTSPKLTNYGLVSNGWYGSTHIAGGTIMGAKKEESVVNTYLQHWDMPNLFVVGASNFPHNPGYNPTLTINALAYRASEGIIKFFKEKRLLA